MFYQYFFYIYFEGGWELNVEFIMGWNWIRWEIFGMYLWKFGNIENLIIHENNK